MTSKILKILFQFGGNRTVRSSSALEKLDGARVGQREPVTGRGTSFDCLRKDKIKGPRASFSHRRKSLWNASLARGHFIGLRYGDFIDRGAEDVESTYYLHAASPLSLLATQQISFTTQLARFETIRERSLLLRLHHIVASRTFLHFRQGGASSASTARIERANKPYGFLVSLFLFFFFLSCKNFDTEYSFWQRQIKKERKKEEETLIESRV